MSLYTFFQNQTADATSNIYAVQDGGYFNIKVTGTFDTDTTLTIEIDFGDNDFAPARSYIFTQSDVKSLQPIKVGNRIRCVLAGAGAGTNVTVKMV